MEKPPYVFRVITHFIVMAVEKRDLRFDYITRLTLEIGSELPKGKYSMELIEPFQPKCRGGEKLSKLKSLDHKDIDSILAFRGSNGEKNARLEIRGKTPDTTITVKCKKFEGILGWNKKRSQ
jgi:hypothetical protein